jgi:hypothetical protein
MGTSANAVRAGRDSNMSKPLKALISYSVLGALCALFMCLDSTTRPIAQLLIVPILMVGLWRASILGVHVPRVVFALAFLGVSIGATLRFSTMHLRDGAFVVATVSKQGLWQETKIYRDRLNRALGSEGRALAGLHRGTIESQGAAETLLAKRPTLGGVIWGAPRWMSISLRLTPAISLRHLSETSFARRWLESNHLQDFLVIRSVSSVGLSHGHQDATVHFIAHLIPLWNELYRYSVHNTMDPDFESRLTDLSRTQARWSTRSHIAFALWMLGTYHLIEAIGGDSMSGGDLARAAREFSDALKQFRPRDNLSLYSAILNNFALATLIQSDFSERRDELRHQALKRVKRAQSVAVPGSKSRADIVFNLITLGVSQGRKSRGSGK